MTKIELEMGIGFMASIMGSRGRSWVRFGRR
jgi:hypothetical protein